MTMKNVPVTPVHWQMLTELAKKKHKNTTNALQDIISDAYSQKK
tara:strand:- start:803 stop:934 length:132 start_codon:yes stop_codon:yes gene_type:complete